MDDSFIDPQKFIHSIENSFPVSTWKIDEIDMWPIIRVRLQTKLRYIVNNNLSIKPSNYANNDLSFIKKISYAYTSYFKLNGLKKVNFIASSSYSHRSIYKGKYYNKFYDPILDEVNHSGLIIEHNSKEYYGGNLIHNKEKVLFFEDLAYHRYFIFQVLKKLKLLRPMRKVELAKYDLFIDKMKEFDSSGKLGEEFEIKKLIPLFFKLKIYSSVYYKIFKKTSPDFCFEICHYNTHSIALSIAAQKLNITSVEIQHGVQPKSHMAYGNWLNIPNKGYNTLPKIYWHWDKESRLNLAEWVSKSDFHRSIVLGNPWIDFVKQQLKAEEKKYILYSLQPLKFEFIFPDYLISFIKKNTQHKWWFRLHPADRNKKEEYNNFFEKIKIKDLIIFDDGTLQSLPEILGKSKLHVTYNSSTVMEAKEFGLRTILLDSKDALGYYRSHVDNGDAFIVSDNFENQFMEVISMKTKETISAINYTSCFKVLEN